MKISLAFILIIFTSWNYTTGQPDEFAKSKLNLKDGDFTIQGDSSIQVFRLIIDNDFVFNGDVPYQLNFFNTVFNGTLDLSDTRFYKSVEFIKCTFNGPVNFSGAEFKKTTEFRLCIFNELTKFDWVFFEDWLVFRNGDHNGAFYAREAGFFNRTFFEENLFNKEVSFKNSEFHELTSFENSKFGEGLDLSQASFISDSADYRLNLSKISVNDELNLYESMLPDSLNLADSEFSKSLDLTTTYIPDQQDFTRINLSGVDLSNTKINYSNFKLWFDEDLSPDQINGIYSNLLKNQRDRGFVESYRKLDHDYQAYKKSFGGFQEVKYYINKFWWDFGHKKEMILWHTASAFIIFLIINIAIFDRLIDTYNIPNIRKSLEEFNEKFKQLKETAQTTSKKMGLWTTYMMNKIVLPLYYTGIVFFGFKLEIQHLNFTKKGLIFYIFVIYIFGLICTLFIANYIISLNIGFDAG